MGNSSSKRGYDWSDKELSKCVRMGNDEAQQWWTSKHMKRWKSVIPNIEVLDNQVVAYLVMSEDGEENVRVTYPPNEPPFRTLRRAMVTKGTLSLITLHKQGGMSVSSCFYCTKSKSNSAKKRNTIIPLHDISSIVLNRELRLVEIYTSASPNSRVPTFVYQASPNEIPEMFLQSIMVATVGAYSGYPLWAIPMRCSIDMQSQPAKVQAKPPDMRDGGFSSSMFALLEGRFLPTYPEQRILLPEGPHEIAKLLDQQQQPLTPAISNSDVLKGYVSLDIVTLVKSVMLGEPKSEMKSKQRSEYLALLNSLSLKAVEKCLPFNLVVRKLQVKNIVATMDSKNNPIVTSGTTTQMINSALTTLLRYNITLIELDLSGTTLTGLGASIGRALAMNAQPLLSRIILNRCGLTQVDVDALVRPGLQRLWCGGSALPESIVVPFSSTPPDASLPIGSMPLNFLSWDALYDTLLNPPVSTSTAYSPIVPRPPPPSLAFLQVLDVRGTLISSTSRLAELVSRSAVRFLGIGGGGSDIDGLNRVLMVLQRVATPHLQTFYGHDIVGGPILSSALFRHQGTLKRVTLENFKGDATALLCQWPSPSTKSKSPLVEFTGNQSSITTCHFSSQMTFPPGSLELSNVPKHVFDQIVSNVLTNVSTGLQSIKIGGVHYANFSTATPAMAKGGLQYLELTPANYNPSKETFPPNKIMYNYVTQPRITEAKFWNTLAYSKTLQTLILPNQLSNSSSQSGGLDMVGQFLKTNRSVRSIAFDSDELTLNIEGVKALRSAFYGNKKVISFEFPSKANKNHIDEFQTSTEECLREVRTCKAEIKHLFKQYYSKYNHNWRSEPNRLKVPYVERIRVAKRKLGKMQRDSQKIATLLQEIKQCVASNISMYQTEQMSKQRILLNRRQNQLEGIARKQERVTAKLVTKLHKAKVRGRKGKGGKTQMRRGDYYKNQRLWHNDGRHDADSHWHSLNDPYYMRCSSSNLSGRSDDYHNNHHNSQRNSLGTNRDGGADYTNLIAGMYVGNALEDLVGFGSDNGNRQDECVGDPWSGVDELTGGIQENTDVAFTPEFLNQMHTEAAELGPDVVADLAPILDEAATVNDQIENVAYSMNIDKDAVESQISQQRNEHDDFDLGMVMEDLGEVPDFIGENDFEDVEDDDAFDEADDVIDMYAGAGPRDLDDGGPTFGKGNNAALSGARRKARARKTYRVLRRVRKATKTPCAYSSLELFSKRGRRRNTILRNYDDTWPENFVTRWNEEIKEKQIESMSKSDLFSFPDFVRLERFLDWSLEDRHRSHCLDKLVQVTLVTQCSMDRLTNLKAQLGAWTGMASVAIYLKNDEDTKQAKNAISKCIKDAKQMVKDTSKWDVAVTLCQSDVDDAPYPINMLRNLALFEAKRRQRSIGIDLGAVFLVDVDFRPSCNLFQALHSAPATTAICHEHKVIVCPAFESVPNTDKPNNINDLLHCLDSGTVEGFHLSQFPQGHGSTNFSRFASVSKKSSTIADMWKKLYQISYQECFEPYVIMATEDVPLYDERFQGYGMNKVSHLATVASNITGRIGGFHVLPGVFIMATMHERSDSWFNIYGSKTDDAKFNRLWLKGLYRNFTNRLNDGKGPMLSPITKSWMMTNLVKKKEISEDHCDVNRIINKELPKLVIQQEQKGDCMLKIANAISATSPSPLVTDLISLSFGVEDIKW